MENQILMKIALLLMIAASFLTSCASSLPASSEVPAQKTFSRGNYNTAMWDENTAITWDKLQHVSAPRLAAMQRNESDPQRKAWIELALLSKKNSLDTPALARQLSAWRERNPSHPANQLFPSNHILTELIASPRPQHIAILLPQEGVYGSSGQIVREGFLNAYYANMSKPGTQTVKFYNTSETTDMKALYQQALADGADLIVGPLVKDHVKQLTSLGSYRYPTLALNYTEPFQATLPSNFYEFGLLPEDEALQIADKARRAGHTKAIVIAPQNLWGKRLVSAFSTRWQAMNGNIQDTWYYSNRSTFNQEIARLLSANSSTEKKTTQENNNFPLESKRREDFDVIFLFTQPQDGRTIVPLLRYHYASNIPIYATSAIYSGKPNPTKDVDLNGVTVCDIPWSRQIARQSTLDATHKDRLYAVGQDAYLLSQSLSRLHLLPNFPIYGKTGALTLTESHQIHRRLPCTTIRNGLI